MSAEFGDKTHDATPLRRQKAREAGQVVRSQDLASALVLCGGLVILWYCGAAVARFLGEVAREHLGGEAWLTLSMQDTSHLVARICSGLAVAVLPVLGLVALAALASQMGQFGFLFLPQKLAFDWQRASPLANWQRIASWSSVVQLGLGMLKVLIIGLVAGWCLWSERVAMMNLTSQPTPEIASHLFHVMFWTGLKTGGALVGLALLDYGYRYWRHEQDLRMSAQELKEEMRQQQGDPQIAARRKEVQRQMALHRLSTTIPKADVVVTSLTNVAVALKYDSEKMAAPIVVAKGSELLARRICDLAVKHRIAIVERSELARTLCDAVENGQPVPAEQYAAVAEIIRYAYQLNGFRI